MHNEVKQGLIFNLKLQEALYILLKKKTLESLGSYLIRNGLNFTLKGITKGNKNRTQYIQACRLFEVVISRHT